MNYVFFFPDEMRADSVSVYGNGNVKMPNYDKLASEGVVFENTFVQHPVCSPSRCSLMTGWYPHVRGHRTLWHLLREDEPSMFKYLKGHNYNVQLFGKNDVFSIQHLPDALEEFKHFDPNSFSPSQRKVLGKSNFFTKQEGEKESEFYSFLKPAGANGLYDTMDMTNITKAIDFLKNRKEDESRPFMLFLPILSPHTPYTAPEEFHDLYDPEEVGELLPSDGLDKPDFYQKIRDYRKLDELPLSYMKKIKAVYLGMNSYVDWMLGQLMEALEESGHIEDTTIIVSSDHGDWAGDYGLVEKWPNALDDKIVKVPLIIKTPGNKKGHRVKAPVELFDIMPTVLELANIPIQHNHFAKSLVPELFGGEGDIERAVFAEGGYDLNEPNCFEGFEGRKDDDVTKFKGHLYYPKGKQQQDYPESVARSTMIRTIKHKLIHRTSGRNELYDMTNDPNELINLYDNHKYENIQNSLEKRMLRWYINTSDVTPWDEDIRSFPSI